MSRIGNYSFKWPEIIREHLLHLGYQPEIFFYAIGDGEDEDDKEIFVKDGVALLLQNGRWYIANYDDLTYQNGFPSDNEIFTIKDLV